MDKIRPLPFAPKKEGTYILAVQKCPICQGTGEVEHPLWEGFFKWRKRRGYKGPYTEEQQRDYFLRFGEKIPQKYIACQDCTGERYITKWRRLDDESISNE